MAKEYIERKPILKFIEDGLNNPDKSKAFGHDAIEIMTDVQYAPTADVVEVVRCEECRFSETCSRTIELIPRQVQNGQLRAVVHYCEYGERRDNNAD